MRTRMFGGNLYKFAGEFNSKREAGSEEGFLRRYGFYVRTTHRMRGNRGNIDWTVYTLWKRPR